MGESFKLDMTPNNKLLAPYVRSRKSVFENNFLISFFQAMIVKRIGNETIEGMAAGENCHYLHQEGDTVAALDMCDQVRLLFQTCLILLFPKDDVHGIVIKGDKRFEVLPLNSRLKRMLDLWKADNNSTE